MTPEVMLGMLGGVICALVGLILGIVAARAEIQRQLRQQTFNAEFLKAIRESGYKGDLMGLYNGLQTLGYDAQTKKLGGDY